MSARSGRRGSGPGLPAGVIQCRTCGVEYDESARGDLCPICADERQYVPEDGVQRWADPADFSGRIELTDLEPGLVGLDVHPGSGSEIGIGQQAKLIVTPHGTVMVDVPAAITAEAVSAVRELGPLRAIIPSHPHMFGLQSVWSQALDGAEVWVALADQQWLGRRPTSLRVWSGAEQVLPGVRATQPGGHFPGSAVVHWSGADGAGVLLSGGTIAANPDGRTVAFMRSYPNRIPLSAAVVERIAAHVASPPFTRLYDNFTGVIRDGASEAAAASARRHAAWVRGDFDHLT